MAIMPIQDFLALADEAGRFRFSTETRAWVTRETGQSLKNFLVAQVMSHMHRYPLFTTGIQVKKRSVKSLDIQATRIPGTSHYEVSFNVARMFLLPGDNPAEELREFREFLDSTKPFFEKWTAHRPSLSVTNHQDRNRRTYGRIRCRYEDAETGENTTAEEETVQLVRRMNSSPVLGSWLTAVALDLNKLGRWSWGHIGDEQIFRPMDNPVMQHIFATRLQRDKE